MGRVGIRPDRQAGEQLVTNHSLILPALFLGDGAAAHYRETGPARSNRLEPEALGRLRFPIARQVRLLDRAVSMWTQELRPVVGELICL